MQENPEPHPESTPADHLCAQCGSANVLAGHPTRLCAGCRQAFINYPIPLWVKAFGAGIIVLVLVSFALSPKNFTAAIALSRAEKQEAAHNYLSEQKELDKAIAIVPNSTQVLAHLMIASFYNGDFKTYGTTIDKLAGKEIEDKDLLTRLNNITADAEGYVPTEKFRKIMDQYPAGIPDTTFTTYLDANPTDVYAIYAHASACFDKEYYPKSDQLLARVLAIDRHHMYALTLRAITKREMNQLDSSLYFAEQMLYDNHQSIMAISSKARTLLKQGKFKDGLRTAQQAEKLDKDFYYNKATLAIAYHLNKQFKERDAIVAQSKKDTLLAAYMQYPYEIISGKRTYTTNTQN